MARTAEFQARYPWVTSGRPRPHTWAQPMESFLRRLRVDESTGCWHITPKTHYYALIPIDARMVMGHRWAYETYVGPIPAGHEIDHLCCVKGCVNPDHLEPVTPGENKRRANAHKKTGLTTLQRRAEAAR